MEKLRKEHELIDIFYNLTSIPSPSLHEEKVVDWVRDFCKNAMWIEGGELKRFGEVNEVCDEYAEYVDFYNSLKKKEKKKLNDEKFAKRILENPQISTWEKILDKLKR